MSVLKKLKSYLKTPKGERLNLPDFGEAYTERCLHSELNIANIYIVNSERDVNDLLRMDYDFNESRPPPLFVGSGNRTATCVLCGKKILTLVDYPYSKKEENKIKRWLKKYYGVEL